MPHLIFYVQKNQTTYKIQIPLDLAHKWILVPSIHAHFDPFLMKVLKIRNL